MKIYTKTGDNGSTHGPGGGRIRKSDPLVAALGTLDELNSHVGLCLACCGDKRFAQIAEVLRPIQGELLAAGAVIGAAGDQARQRVSLDDAAIERMERQIDAMTEKLPALTHFILPGGCEPACRLHVARCVCRRAEREMVVAFNAGLTGGEILLRYLNRLGDLLFTAARAANAAAGTRDALWKP